MRQSKIGSVISQIDERNKDLKDYAVLGINRDKTFIPTVANMDGVDVSKYKIVRKGTFVFSGMQTGRDICIRIALYDKETPCIISPAYTTFCMKDSEKIIPEYFFLYFNRDESDRYGAFISDSSVRANLDWERFINIEIPLPSIEEQEKVVNAWKAYREIKEQNEAIYAPLMQVCQSYIQELKHKYKSEEIGEYIEEIDERNYKLGDFAVLGINRNKEFIPTVANLEGVDVSKYKVVRKGMFVFSGMQTGRDMCIRIALYNEDNPCVISPAYTTFCMNDTKKILPEYLFMYFKRDESDRYGAFLSDSSVRANLDWNRFVNISIPLPPIEIQQAIVNIYNCANEAKRIAEEADRKSREICPALIQHVNKQLT